jgi:hypothetical protein
MMVPYLVVRANNIALSALAPLTRSAQVEAAAAQLARDRTALDAMRAATCDELYRLSSTAPETYRSLIDAKRRIFNNAGLDDVLGRHRDLLRAHPSLHAWIEQAETVVRQENALRALFGAEIGRARDFAQTLSGTPEFLHAMAMTRAQVFQSARQYAQCTQFDDKKALNDEETIYRYLTRAIVKVSPFSTFTSVGFTPLQAGQDRPMSLLGGRAIGGKFSLDRAGFLKLFEKFMLRHQRHWRFRMTENRIGHGDGELCYLFMDKPEYYAYRTTFIKLRISNRALFSCEEGANGWLTWDVIAARLPPSAEPDALLAKWVGAGLMQFDPQLDEESADLLGQFLEVARAVGAADQAAAPALAILERMARARGALDGASPAALVAQVGEIHSCMAELARELDYALIKSAGLVYHDSYIPDLAPASHDEIAGFAEQIQEFLHHYLGDNFHSGFSDATLAAVRAAMAGVPQLGVFAFYELVQQCASRMSADDSAPRRTLPILQLYDEVWRRRGEAEIVLEPVALVQPARTAFAAYGHLWNGSFVLNNVDSGYLRCFSRFFTFTDELAILAACRGAYGGKLEAAYDFYDTFGFNTAYRPRICGKRIWLDRPAATKPGDLALADLAVRWPDGAPYPELVDRATGAPVALRQTGLFTRELYPKLIEMLLRFGMADAPCYFAFRFGLHKIVTDAGLPAVVVIPRVRYRDIVLSRRQWWIPKTLLPLRAPQEALFEYFARIDAWRREHAIPQRAFVRRHSEDKVLDRDTSNGKKPLFVDFTAPIMSRMIARIFNTPFDMLSVEEMIPDCQDQRATHGGQAYANEILFEVGSNELF